MQPDQGVASATARPVAVGKVITQDVPLYLDEIGTCTANESVQVQAQVNGQIVSRDFKDGADVKKGDLLFTIDKRPYQAALDAAKADNMLAQANLKRQLELQAKDVHRNAGSRYGESQRHADAGGGGCGTGEPGLLLHSVAD